MSNKLKAGITGFRFEHPWEQFETIANIGYKTSQHAVGTLQRAEGNLEENIARYKALGLEFYCVGVQKSSPIRFSRNLEEMCTIRKGYVDIGFDHLSTDDKAIEDTISVCEKFGVKLVTSYSTPALNTHFGLGPCEKDVYYEALEGHDKIAEKFAKAGIRYTYHNHDVEFKTHYDGLTAFDQLLARTSYLALELDVGWVAVAGYDPVEVINRAHDRIASIHVKDYVPGLSKNNFDMDFPRFTAVGTGLLNLSGVLEAAQAHGFETVIVEQDQLRNLDVKETLTASYLNMKETGFVG